MGRPAKPENRWLREAGLKHVTVSKGRYVLRRWVDGRYEKEIVLCSDDATPREVIKRYDEVTSKPTGTLEWLLDTYLVGVQHLEPRTKKEYQAYRATLCDLEVNGAPWGKMKLDAFTKRTIRNYLDWYPAKIQANRHVQFLKAAWNWMIERHNIPENPCLGVKLNKQTARDRYITDDEYDALINLAWSREVPYMAVLIELAYLTRARRGELLALRQENITDDGLLLKRTKGSKSEITRWSPRLKAALDAAKKLHPNTISPWILHRTDGSPITSKQCDMSWKRLMETLIKQGVVEPSNTFTFHDLKARGVSDHPDKHSGHKSEKMKAVYDRLPDKVDPTR